MITSFYSYKGGVGRTQLALECAVQLAGRGRRVVFWDLDLEAPGVQRNPSLAPLDRSVRTGTIDVVEAFLRDGAYPEELVADSLLDLPIDGRGSLRFLLPGQLDGDPPYDARFAAVDWSGLFDPQRGPGLVLFLRLLTQLEAGGEVDHVIIDGRTGLNELAALCVAEMPNLLVLVTNASEQGRQGTKQVREAVARRRQRDPLARQVRVLPVASMVPGVAMDGGDAALRRLVDAVARRARDEAEVVVPFAVRQMVDERPPSLAGVAAEAEAVRPLVERIEDERARLEGEEAREHEQGRARRIGDAERRLRGHEGHERGHRFEDEVAVLFRMRGADVTTDRQEHDKEFDIWATYRVGTSKLVEIVECKDTAPVDPKVVREFAAKVDQVRRRDPRGLYQAILVSRNGFTSTARTTADEEGVELRTADDLTRDLVDLTAEQRAIREQWTGTALESLYVEPSVIVHGRAKAGEAVTTASLREEVRRWLGDPAMAIFALLGDFGAGKTTFCQSVAAELAEQAAADGSARVPVLIDLRFTRTTHASLDGLLRAHLDRRGIDASPAALRQRSRAGHLVLIFDGLDEMLGYAEPVQFAENLRQILSAAEGGAKALLTCRTNFFRDRPEELDLIGSVPASVRRAETTPLWALVSDQPGTQIGYLAPFTRPQIREYLNKAAGDEAGILLQTMEDVHGLVDLGRVPYLLDLIVKAGPELRRLKGRTISVADLYEVFAQQWLRHGRRQLRLLQRDAERVVEELARRLWEAPDQGLHYEQIAELAASVAGDQPAYGRLEREQIDYEIRSALFLSRDSGGYFRFSHRSFHEFFLARGLKARLLARDPAALDVRPLTKEVVAFLCGMPDAADAVARCSDVLAEPPRRRVSENALVVAHWAARDHGMAATTQGARLAGADLGGLDLDGIDLRSADLTEANLANASLVAADLREADLSGAALAFAVLHSARLDGASLRAAAADHAVGRSVSLRGADLDAADLSFARLVDADLHDVKGRAGVDGFGASYARCRPPEPADGTGRYDDPAVTGAVRIPGAGGSITALAWHPVRPDLLACATGGRVRVVDLTIEATVADLESPGGVLAVAWSPDGARLASGADDGTVRLWDAATATEAARMEGRGGWVGAVAWSPDGARLASGADDGTVRLWDAEQHEVDDLVLFADGTESAVVIGSRLARVTDGLLDHVVVRIGLVNHPIREVPERLDPGAFEEALRAFWAPA